MATYGALTPKKRPLGEDDETSELAPPAPPQHSPEAAPPPPPPSAEPGYEQRTEEPEQPYQPVTQSTAGNGFRAPAMPPAPPPPPEPAPPPPPPPPPPQRTEEAVQDRAPVMQSTAGNGYRPPAPPPAPPEPPPRQRTEEPEIYQPYQPVMQSTATSGFRATALPSTPPPPAPAPPPEWAQAEEALTPFLREHPLATVTDSRIGEGYRPTDLSPGWYGRAVQARTAPPPQRAEAAVPPSGRVPDMTVGAAAPASSILRIGEFTVAEPNDQQKEAYRAAMAQGMPLASALAAAGIRVLGNANENPTASLNTAQSTDATRAQFDAARGPMPAAVPSSLSAEHQQRAKAAGYVLDRDGHFYRDLGEGQRVRYMPAREGDVGGFNGGGELKVGADGKLQDNGYLQSLGGYVPGSAQDPAVRGGTGTITGGSIGGVPIPKNQLGQPINLSPATPGSTPPVGAGGPPTPPPTTYQPSAPIAPAAPPAPFQPPADSLVRPAIGQGPDRAGLPLQSTALGGTVTPSSPAPPQGQQPSLGTGGLDDEYAKGEQALTLGLARSRMSARRRLEEHAASRGLIGSSVEADMNRELEADLAVQEQQGLYELSKQRNEQQFRQFTLKAEESRFSRGLAEQVASRMQQGDQFARSLASGESQFAMSHGLQREAQALQKQGMDRDESYRYAQMNLEQRLRTEAMNLQRQGMNQDEAYRYAALNSDERFKNMQVQLQRQGMDADQAFRQAEFQWKQQYSSSEMDFRKSELDVRKLE